MADNPQEQFDVAVEILEEGAAPAEAVELLRQVVAVQPEHAAAWYHLGYARAQVGDIEGGSAALERALLLREDPAVLFHLGYCRIEQGRPADARRLFERCLELGGPVSARYEIAWSYQVEGLHPQAAEAARLYVLEVQDDPDGWELYQAECRRLGHEKIYQRFLARHADRALLELLRGRDSFSMGGPPFPVPVEGLYEGPIDPKLEFLAQAGSAYLGGADDDGVNVPNRRRFRLSMTDAAIMLARMRGVLDLSGQRVQRIVAIDSESGPLAKAAGQALGVPTFPVGDEAAAPPLHEGATLLLQGIGHDYLAYRRACLRQSSAYLTLVMALDWFQAGLPFDKLYVPDICGCLALKVDWQTDDWKDSRLVERILTIFRELGELERTRQRQYFRLQPGLRIRHKPGTPRP